METSQRTAQKPSKNPSSKSPAEDLKRLEKILELMERHEVAEIEWDKGGERLKLRKKNVLGDGGMASPIHMGYPAHYPQFASQAAPEPKSVKAAAEVTPPAKTETKANQKQVTSPFVGTFYRSASPEAEVYVREGQAVKRGDVLCIIEAMKLMNEIEAEFPGKIVSVLVENGQPVEFGEPLFIVEC